MPPTYTLDEAKRELAQQECMRHGHNWDVLETFGPEPPIRITCSRCGRSHRVEQEQSSSN